MSPANNPTSTLHSLTVCLFSLPNSFFSGERRQGNKFVTRVVGVEAFLLEPSALAAECQRKYACSTTVGDLPGKNNPGQEVILQVRGECCVWPTRPSSGSGSAGAGKGEGEANSHQQHTIPLSSFLCLCLTVCVAVCVLHVLPVSWSCCCCRLTPQGNWIEKLPDHLMKVYGIPKKYFLVKK